MNKLEALCHAVTIALAVIAIAVHEQHARQVQEHTEPNTSVVVNKLPVISVQKHTRPNTSNCLSSYPDFCMPPGTPDIDYPDIPFSNFAVRGNDPHHFDRDNDGVGCESR